MHANMHQVFRLKATQHLMPSGEAASQYCLIALKAHAGTVWQGRREWADRPEDATDAVQDGEGLLQALHDAQPDQEVLQHDVQSIGMLQLKVVCLGVTPNVPTKSLSHFSGYPRSQRSRCAHA